MVGWKKPREIGGGGGERERADIRTDGRTDGGIIYLAACKLGGSIGRRNNTQGTSQGGRCFGASRKSEREREHIDALPGKNLVTNVFVSKGST